MSKLDLKNVSKVYEDGKKSVKSINIDVKENEFLVLVGPSGCGKSSTLRMIAGLEEVTEGEIFLNGDLLNHIPAKNRNIAMVFQNYALYPHMTVYENMAFSLKLSKMPKKTIDTKVKEVAESLEITEILNKKPSKISGGQKQRVALGRAIIRNPQVFLMDEPLSNLDAKLRLNMRMEIIRLHKKLNTTFIYVTHDQVEAMTMADRMAVMNNGKIMQIDSPEAIYEKPQNLFVAEFIGSPKINILKGKIDHEHIIAKVGNEEIKIPKVECIKNQDLSTYVDKPIRLGFRPEDIEITNEAFDMESVVDVLENLGSEKYIHLENSIALKLPSSFKVKSKDRLRFRIKRDRIHLFDEESGNRL